MSLPLWVGRSSIASCAYNFESDNVYVLIANTCDKVSLPIANKCANVCVLIANKYDEVYVLTASGLIKLACL